MKMAPYFGRNPDGTEWNNDSGHKEPIAWLVQCKRSGLVEQAEPNEKASNPKYWTDAFPVFTAPMTVSLTDDQILEAMHEHIYAADGGYVFDTAKADVIAAGRALLEKVKETSK